MNSFPEKYLKVLNNVNEHEQKKTIWGTKHESRKLLPSNIGNLSYYCTSCEFILTLLPLACVCSSSISTLMMEQSSAKVSRWLTWMMSGRKTSYKLLHSRSSISLQWSMCNYIF